MFHFPVVPQAGCTSLKGTASYTCATVKVQPLLPPQTWTTQKHLHCLFAFDATGLSLSYCLALGVLLFLNPPDVAHLSVFAG